MWYHALTHYAIRFDYRYLFTRNSPHFRHIVACYKENISFQYYWCPGLLSTRYWFLHFNWPHIHLQWFPDISGCLNIKMLSYPCGDSHSKNKMVSQPSHLYEGNPYTQKDGLYIEMGPWCCGNSNIIQLALVLNNLYLHLVTGWVLSNISSKKVQVVQQFYLHPVQNGTEYTESIGFLVPQKKRLHK